MADKTKQFNGFELLTEAQFNKLASTDKQKIYFVRTSTGTTKDDGFIYFNGKKYGTGKLVADTVLTKLTALTDTVNDHIDNKATVTGTERTGTTDNGTITVNDSTKWMSGEAIAEIKKYVDSEDVKSMKLVGKEIQLQSTTGAVLAKLDASEFIQDGMLQSVELADSTTEGKVLRFTWNTDSGKEKTTTDIEVSEFFHEISGDTKTIDVVQPKSGTTGSLQISAKTVESVAAVTSGATALMTGGITQQYVTQEIQGLQDKLDSELVLDSTYAALTIKQTDGILTEEGSSLQVNVARGLTTDNAGFVYKTSDHTFTVNATSFTKNGLLDAQEVITLLRTNNTNVASALTYLKGQITELSNNMTTVSGSTYITVTKSADTNDYTVSASDTLQTAIANATNAVQSVNGKTGTGVTINSSEIQLGQEINGHKTTDSVTTVLDDIYKKLSQTSSDALTTVVGSNSIDVTAKKSGSQTISVKAKSLSETEKAAGQIEIITTGTTGIYGLLYFGGDDVEE